MSAADEPAVRPTTETNVLLGRLMEKVDSVKEEQQLNRAEVAAFRTEVGNLRSDVAVLKSQQAPRLHWVTILVGVVALAGFALALLDRIYA